MDLSLIGMFVLYKKPDSCKRRVIFSSSRSLFVEKGLVMDEQLIIILKHTLALALNSLCTVALHLECFASWL